MTRERFVLLALAASLGTPKQAQGFNELFRDLEAEAVAGCLFPQGRMGGAFDPGPMGGARLTGAYFGPWKAHAQFFFNRLDGPGSPAVADLYKGGVGLERRSAVVWIPASGLGFSLHRLSISRWKPDDGPEPFLEGGESEFGVYPFLRWHALLDGAWSLSATCQWDIVFTGPAYSHMASLQLGLGRRLP